MSNPTQSPPNASNRVIRELRRDINRLRKQYATARSQIAAFHMVHTPPLEFESWCENEDEEVNSPQNSSSVPVEPDLVDDNSIDNSEEVGDLEVGIQSSQEMDVESEELCTVVVSRLSPTEDIPKQATSYDVNLDIQSSIDIPSMKEERFSKAAAFAGGLMVGSFVAVGILMYGSRYNGHGGN